MQYGDQVSYDLKTGKEIRTPADDAWVIENIRYVELSADKTTIKADGKDSVVVTATLKTGELVSKPERKDVLDDVIIAIVVDGERYALPLIMGEGEFKLVAVHAGSYEITVDETPHNKFVIEVSDAGNNAGEETSGTEASGGVKDEGGSSADPAGESGIQGLADGSSG